MHSKEQILNLHQRLSQRIHKDDILQFVNDMQEDSHLHDEIYRLIFDDDDRISYQALWVCTHLTVAQMEWLNSKRDELIDAVLLCSNSGKRRMFLSLLCRLQMNELTRIDILNFCLDRMTSSSEPAAIQSLCIKLAHRITNGIPELKQELQSILELMEPESLTPATRSVRRNTLKAIRPQRRIN